MFLFYIVSGGFCGLLMLILLKCYSNTFMNISRSIIVLSEYLSIDLFFKYLGYLEVSFFLCLDNLHFSSNLYFLFEFSVL